MNTISTLSVRRRPGFHPHHGLLVAGNQMFPCLLGRSGIATNKMEGDGKTPIGTFLLLSGYYRRDRVSLPTNQITMHAIRPADGWCDAPQHPNYNRLIKKPFGFGHESMSRGDSLYDICLVMDYNINPRSRYRGSAIFFHVASPQGKATQGCIALPLPVIQKLLPRLAKKTTIQIIG